MSNLIETIYTPNNSLKNPILLFKQMWSDLIASFEPAYRLLVRDIKTEYRQSLLGIFWAVIAPVFASASFILANSAKIINVGNVDLPYPAYVMFSMTLWQLFLGAFQAPISALASAGGLMTHIKFRYETSILKQIWHLFYNLFFKMLLIIALFIFFKLPLNWTILLVPFALVIMIMFGALIGLLLAPIHMLYKDIGRIIELAMPFLMFITPVIYAVPETGGLATLMKLNPVTFLLVTVRELATMGTVSFPFQFLLISLITLIIFPFAWLFVRLSVPFLVERFI
jgi:lipopolysaccharide transport system permease protein